MKLKILIGLLLCGLVFPLPAVVAPVQPQTESQEKEALIREEVRKYKQELRNMSRRERRAHKREKRKAVKAAIRDAREAEADADQVLLIILAILLPPLAVFLHEGELNGRFWLSLLLTLLFFLPGIIYALIVILG